MNNNHMFIVNVIDFFIIFFNDAEKVTSEPHDTCIFEITPAQ